MQIVEIVAWLVALVPVLSFGLIPVVGTLIGGKPVQQSMGIALGGLLFSTAILIFKRPEITPHILLIGMLSGVFWSVGSIGQFQGIRYLGVARATPMINGGQIIGTSLVGVALGEWATPAAKGYGFSALVLIIAGIVLTSYRQHTTTDAKPQWGRGILINAAGVLGFTAYIGILKYYRIDSWSSIFPQSIGQIAALALCGPLLLRTRPFSRKSVQNGVVGLIWGVGNLALLLSQVRLGLAVAYPVSQAAVIVSVFGGVFLNKERKSRREWLVTGIGIGIICAGLCLIYLTGNA